MLKFMLNQFTKEQEYFATEEIDGNVCLHFC